MRKLEEAFPIIEEMRSWASLGITGNDWGRRMRLASFLEKVEGYRKKASRLDDYLNEHQDEAFLKDMVSHQRKEIVVLKETIYHISNAFPILLSYIETGDKVGIHSTLEVIGEYLQSSTPKAKAGAC